MKKKYCIWIAGICLLAGLSCFHIEARSRSGPGSEAPEFPGAPEHTGYPDWWVADSIRLEQVLLEAVESVAEGREQPSFYKEYEVTLEEMPVVGVEIQLDYCFTADTPHLVIRLRAPGNSVFIDVYAWHDGGFEKVISHRQTGIGYEGDVFRDINGDGRTDYVVCMYGLNGCCLKGFHKVYLLRADGKTFSEGVEFINPTFSPAEGVVRGIGYGHVGDTEMYTYRWNGEKIDTLEYVYFSDKSTDAAEGTEKTKQVIVSAHSRYVSDPEIWKYLDDVPEEYKAIDGYWWFAGDWP